MTGFPAIELMRCRRRAVTRLFVGALVAAVAGVVLCVAALSDALGQRCDPTSAAADVVDANGGSGAWTALAFAGVGAVAILGGTIAAVVSWIAALLDHVAARGDGCGSLRCLPWGCSASAVGMIAYVVAGPDGTEQSGRRVVSSAAPAG